MTDYDYPRLLVKGKVIEIFVYGTLRSDQPLHNWLADDIDRKCEATAQGSLYFFGDTGYPVAFFDEGSAAKIHGEVFTVNLTETVLSCIQMEIRAGYECRWVTTTFENGKSIKSLTFEFRDRDHDLIGDRIPSGDWLDVATPFVDPDEVLCNTISEMICADAELYGLILDEIEEEVKAPGFTEEDAIDDLELMLFNPIYTKQLKIYLENAQQYYDNSESDDEQSDEDTDAATSEN